MWKLIKMTNEQFYEELMQHDVVMLGEDHFNKFHEKNEVVIVNELLHRSIDSYRTMQLAVENFKSDLQQDFDRANTDKKRRVLYRYLATVPGYSASLVNEIIDPVLRSGFRVIPFVRDESVPIMMTNYANEEFSNWLAPVVSNEVLTVGIVGALHVLRKSFPEIGVQQKLPKKVPGIKCTAVILDDEDEPAGVFKEGPDYRIRGVLKSD